MIEQAIITDTRDENERATRFVRVGTQLLRIERRGQCNRCGQCCKTAKYPSWLTTRQLDAYREMGDNGYNDGYCFYFNPSTMTCAIYNDRPQRCLWPQNEHQLSAVTDCGYRFVRVHYNAASGREVDDDG